MGEKHEPFLSLGDRRGWRADDLRRHRRDVLAGRVPGADGADTGWSRAGISSAMTLNFLVMGLGGFGWGAASDRYGARTSC